MLLLLCLVTYYNIIERVPGWLISTFFTPHILVLLNCWLFTPDSNTINVSMLPNHQHELMY